jgi:hypothetical protein
MHSIFPFDISFGDEGADGSLTGVSGLCSGIGGSACAPNGSSTGLLVEVVLVNSISSSSKLTTLVRRGFYSWVCFMFEFALTGSCVDFFSSIQFSSWPLFALLTSPRSKIVCCEIK